MGNGNEDKVSRSEASRQPRKRVGSWEIEMGRSELLGYVTRKKKFQIHTQTNTLSRHHYITHLHKTFYTKHLTQNILHILHIKTEQLINIRHNIQPHTHTHT